MGLTKTLIAEDEQKWQAAIQIGIKSGVLKRCEMCEKVTIDESQELEQVYRFANALFTRKDPLTRKFKNRRELTDMLKNLPFEFNTECLCDMLISEDD